MPSHPVILFDGVCHFCNGAINLLLKQDKEGRLRFAPLQSESGQQLLEKHRLPHQDFNSFVLIENGQTYQKSTAALRLLSYLPWYWQPLRVFRIIPSFLRDKVYDLVARNRYRWFGRKDSCMIPTQEMRKRFL
jgi:predicted DCC family thiol-disulfide oxidoreductase YuxK